MVSFTTSLLTLALALSSVAAAPNPVEGAEHAPVRGWKRDDVEHAPVRGWKRDDAEHAPIRGWKRDDGNATEHAPVRGWKRSPFAINLGNTPNQNVAWVHGDDKCSFVVMSNIGDNPCGHTFELHGETGFVLNGCGGAQFITQNGQFWAGCQGLSEKDKCHVHTTGTCSS